MEALEDRRLLSVFAVNSVLDKIDRHPGNGWVDTGVSKQVTLRAAVMEANAKAGADKITLPAGHFSLTRANPAGVVDENYSRRGDLDIRGPLTIEGKGAGVTIINASNLDRIFHIHAGTVTLKNLTITGGRTQSHVYPYTSYGGGILNHSVLKVINCAINANVVGGDIAAYGAGIATTGPLTVRRSTISNNAAFATYRSHEFGGGIYAVNASPVTIDNSIVFHNGATRGGGIYLTGVGNANITRTTVSSNYSVEMTPGPGGLWAEGSTLNVSDCLIADNAGIGFHSSGWGKIVDSTVSGNTQSSGINNSGELTIRNVAIMDNPGGGIANGNNATMTITNAQVTGNLSGISNGYGGILTVIDSNVSGNGGGIGNSGTVTVRGSTITDNESSGLGNNQNSTAIVINSTLSGNHTTWNGGGILNNRANLTLINSTVSGNSADREGGGILNTGTATIHNATIAYNEAAQGGGGIINGGTATLANTICASNIASLRTDVNGNFTSQGYNLIGDAGTATGFGATDLLNVNPNLESLANNGGRTSTHALPYTSPAVDAGNPGFNPNSFSPPLTRDQRNFPRVFDGDDNGSGVVDIGAYERMGVPEYGIDWGDAPDVSVGPRPGFEYGNPYPTLYYHHGANHVIDPNFRLGAYIDADNGGSAHPEAIGDDVNPAGAPNDEDGVVLRSEALLPGKVAVFTINVHNPSGKNAYIDAWFDENQVGGFESAERFLHYQTVQHGANHFYWPVPLDANPGTYFARFRLTSVGQPTPWGPAGDGEVEDYRIEIPPLAEEQVGIRRGTTFFLDANGNGTWNGRAAGDMLNRFGGRSTDKPICGDWNGDGVTEVGVRRGSWFLLDFNGNGVWDKVAGGDRAYRFFKASDTPVIGDWNGDGVDEIGVRRGTTFYVDYNGNGRWNAAADGDRVYAFGQKGQPVVGDFDGDGRDEVGVHRGLYFFLDYNGNGRWNKVAGGDKAYRFNQKGTGVVGDFNGDGKDEIGVHRGTWFFVDYNGNGRWNKVSGDDRAYRFNQTGTPLVGNWKAADALLAVGGPAATGTEAAMLSTDLVTPVLQQAIDTFASLPLTARQLQTLQQIDVRIADLPGATLGRALDTTITLDQNAAGYGWFVDVTPGDNVEFAPLSGTLDLAASSDTAAENRIDLLTTVLHEMGHLLDYSHEVEGVMRETLGRGTRRVWDRVWPFDDEAELGDLSDASDLPAMAVDRIFATP